MRDFWMPFAPAIMIDRREKYLRMRSSFRCPFMVMGSETTEAAHNDLPAALHPFDRTARPQLVDPKHHPRFYRVIQSFERLTGVGGVLNTSFNIHGEPIVCSPEDAIHTLVNSDLDAIQIENHYIERVRE
jgi:carbamoyltransferase